MARDTKGVPFRTGISAGIGLAIAVGLGVSSLVWHFGGGSDLTLPWLAFGLMILGLLTQVQPMAWEKTEAATKWANHMAIPFLLYAAVVALLDVSGLYGAGVSNLWLAFLFAGILSIYGFDWREFMTYAAVITVYMTVVVLGLLVIL